MKNALILAGLLVLTSLAVFGQGYITQPADALVFPVGVAGTAHSGGLLLDGHAPGADGGTGQSFEWGMIPADLDYPLILAGGLDVDNVLGAVRAVQPYAVDVSSGVESEKGIKDAALVTAFMNNVRQANNERN